MPVAGLVRRLRARRPRSVIWLNGSIQPHNLNLLSALFTSAIGSPIRPDTASGARGERRRVFSTIVSIESASEVGAGNVLETIASSFCLTADSDEPALNGVSNAVVVRDGKSGLHDRVRLQKISGALFGME